MRLKVFVFVLFIGCISASAQRFPGGQPGSVPANRRYPHVCFNSLECAAPPVGLAVWYRFESNNNNDDDNARNYRPSIGYGVGALRHGPGVVGQGIELNGVGSYVYVFGTPAFPPPSFGDPLWLPEIGFFDEEFSVAVWFKTSNKDFQVAPILEQRSESPAGYLLVLNGGRPAFQLAAPVRFPGDLGHSSWITTTPDLRDGEWHHVVVSVDRTSSTGGLFYVDGALALTFDPTPYEGRHLENFAPLLIGRHMDGSLWKGSIDEVMIIQKALDAAEVQRLWNVRNQPLCPC
ncbi:MAG: LamG domain-containing protein [Acidobacteriota bacterium]